MSVSNYCFLTCVQISQEAGKVVWYSHLFMNFPQFVVIHIVKGFGIFNKAEVDVFLELSCFFYDPMHVDSLISGSLCLYEIHSYLSSLFIFFKFVYLSHAYLSILTLCNISFLDHGIFLLLDTSPCTHSGQHYYANFTKISLSLYECSVDNH